MIVNQDVLWCPILSHQVKTLLASLYGFMPVHLLGSSSPAVSIPTGIIFEQSGTLDCRPPSLVKLHILRNINHLLSITLVLLLSVVFSSLCFTFFFNQFLFLLVLTESSEPPTPHYNNSVLGDLLPRAHFQFLSAVSSQCSAFVDGVALLKVWLRQRELDQVGG